MTRSPEPSGTVPGEGMLHKCSFASPEAPEPQVTGGRECMFWAAWLGLAGQLDRLCGFFLLQRAPALVPTPQGTYEGRPQAPHPLTTRCCFLLIRGGWPWEAAGTGSQGRRSSAADSADLDPQDLATGSAGSP